MAADGSIKIDTKIDSTKLPGQLKAMENACKSSTGVIGNAFAKLRDVMQGPVLAAKMVKDGLVAIGKAVIGPAAEIEDFVAAFTPLTGSVKDAKIMIAALNKEAATTPFELKDIAAVGKQLLPVLGNDVKAVTETFRMLGDTAGGNAEKLDSIARGYVKVMNTGKVSMEALNMISDAGVPIQNQLAKSMGITVEQMYTLSSQGKISSEELTKAFQNMTKEGGIFYNGMAVASETLTGKVSTMQDSINMAGAAIGERLLPYVKDIVTGISDAANNIADFASGQTDLTKTTNDLITASQNYEKAVRNLDSAQKGISETERALLTGRKELARLQLQTALSETSKGYAKTREEIEKLSEKEKQQNEEIQRQTELITIWRNIIEAPPTMQLAMAQQAGVRLDTVSESFKKSAKNLEKSNSELLQTQTKLQSITIEYTESIAQLGRAVNDGTLNIDIYKLTNKELYNEIMKSAEAQKTLAKTTTSTSSSQKSSTKTTQENTNSTQENTDAKNDNADATTKQQQSARNWANAIGKIAGSLENELGSLFTGIIQDVANIGDNLISVVQTGGTDILAWAGLISSAIPLLETMFGNTSFEAALAARQAEIMADAVKSAGSTLAEVLQSGGSSFEGYLGSKQAQDYIDKVTAKYEMSAALMAHADEILASRNFADYISGVVKMKENMAAQMQAEGSEALKAADNLQYVYDTVYAGNKVTANTSSVLEKWATELESVVTAYGETSKEVAAVNESYQKLLNDALYPTAAALRDANATLKTNSTLWTDAAKATYAFESSLSAIREKAASFYESFSNIGADISDTLVNSLVDGLDENKFMTSIKEFIMKAVIQAAIYTEEMTKTLAEIGKKIAVAISSGLTGDALSNAMKDIKTQLASVWATAKDTASKASDVLTEVFGTGEDTATIEKSRQEELAKAIAEGKTSEQIAAINRLYDAKIGVATGYNTGIDSIARGMGGSLTPSFATTGGQTININLTSQNVTQLDGRTIAVSVAENIDTVLAAM
jgi:tape measure domain-containing protein